MYFFNTKSFFQFYVSGWGKHYNYRCQPVTYDNDPTSIRVSLDYMRNCFKIQFIFLSRSTVVEITRILAASRNVLLMYYFCRWLELSGCIILLRSPSYWIRYSLFCVKGIVKLPSFICIIMPLCLQSPLLVFSTMRVSIYYLEINMH